MNKKLIALLIAMLFVGITIAGAMAVVSDSSVTAESYNGVYHASTLAELQAYVDACTVERCVVQIGEGIIPGGSTQIDVPSNTKILGTGMHSTILNGARFVPEVGAVNISIGGFSLDTRYSDEVPFQFHKNGLHDDIIIHDVYVEDFNSSPLMFNGSKLVVENVHFENVLFGVQVKRGGCSEDTELIVRNSWIRNINWNSSGGTEDGEGIELNCHNGNGSLIVENNYIAGFLEQGIDFNGRKLNLVGNVISGPWFDAQDAMLVAVQSSHPVGYDANIVGNIFTDIKDRGVWVEYYANSVNVVGNTFVGNGTAGELKGLWLVNNAVDKSNNSMDSMNVMSNHFRNLSVGIYTNINDTTTEANFIGNTYEDVTTNIDFNDAVFGLVLDATENAIFPNSLEIQGNAVVKGTTQFAGNVDVNTTLYVAQNIIHQGDADTYFQFLDDRPRFYAGGNLWLEYQGGATLMGSDVRVSDKIRYTSDTDNYIDFGTNTFDLYVDDDLLIDMTTRTIDLFAETKVGSGYDLTLQDLLVFDSVPMIMGYTGDMGTLGNNTNAIVGVDGSGNLYLAPKTQSGALRDIEFRGGLSADILAEITYNGEFSFDGVSSDGTGKALCVKADGNIGTCSDAVSAGGTCTCG